MNAQKAGHALKIAEIEAILRSVRPVPTAQFRRRLEQRYARAKLPVGNSFSVQWRKVALVVILLLAIAFVLSPTGQALAQKVTSLFRFAEETQRVESISLTPRPSPNPEYPYNEFTLSEAAAEVAAGFEIRTLENFLAGMEGWQFHDFRYKGEQNRVDQLYIYRVQDEIGIYLIVSAQSSFFDEDWGACPNSTLYDVQVNGLEAEILSGAVWTTYTKATPGAAREWHCELVEGHGAPMALRWAEAGLYYQISVNQFETRSDLILDQQDLVDLAEGLQ